MSDYFQFEKNLEGALVDSLTKAGVQCNQSRDINKLGATNVQVGLAYMGAMDDARQLKSNVQEYDLHQASVDIQVTTYRENFGDHYNIVGQIRAVMLNHKKPFGTDWYYVFDIKPQSTAQVEDEENNTDQTTLTYNIYFKLNFTNLK